MSTKSDILKQFQKDKYGFNIKPIDTPKLMSEIFKANINQIKKNGKLLC